MHAYGHSMQYPFGWWYSGAPPSRHHASGVKYDRDASRRFFKKRARVAGRAEIESELFELELDAAGVERARDLWPPKFGVKWIGYGAHRVPGFNAWDDHCRYDDYPYDDYRDSAFWDYDQSYEDWLYRVESEDRKCWNCLFYKDSCSCGYKDPTESGWVTLWVDGVVETPVDWAEVRAEQELAALAIDDYYSNYDPYEDWDDWSYPGETEFWMGSPGTQAPPSTEVLVRERESEKLRAGNRYYRQNRRVA